MMHKNETKDMEGLTSMNITYEETENGDYICAWIPVKTIKGILNYHSISAERRKEKALDYIWKNLPFDVKKEIVEEAERR